MVLLMKMETKVILGNMLIFTFGQSWYLYLLVSIIRFVIFNFLWFLLLNNVLLPFSFSMQVGGRIERTSHISDIVKQTFNAWTFGGGGKNTMNKFNQMTCLWEYLQYLQLRKEYDEKKVGAIEQKLNLHKLLNMILCLKKVRSFFQLM